MYSNREPQDTNMFLINRTIWPLHTNTAQKKPERAIVLGTHCHTPVITTVYPAPPVDQFIQRQFKLDVTGFKNITYNTPEDMPLLEENGRDFSTLIPLLHSLTLKGDTMIEPM